LKSKTNAYGLSSSPTLVIEAGSRSTDAHFRSTQEADAFEISEDGSSMVLSPLSDSAVKTNVELPVLSDGEMLLPPTVKSNLRSSQQVPTLSVQTLHRIDVASDNQNDHHGDPDRSADDESEDGVFFASKLIDDDVSGGNGQVGGWSTFLEENLSSSAASEADNASISDACADIGHDSSSLKTAFQDTLAKVTSPASFSGPSDPAPDKSALRVTNTATSSSDASKSTDRFSQQQPLARPAVSRQSFPPSVPAAKAISLIPVSRSPPIAEHTHHPADTQSEMQQVSLFAVLLC
jgi:hypothetical protein